jgi:Holliday junction resolvase YEN1
MALHLCCERLAQLPVTPSFVFDGPERPNFKCDKIVRGSDHWLVEPFKEMLDGYGFRHFAVCDFLFCSLRLIDVNINIGIGGG